MKDEWVPVRSYPIGLTSNRVSRISGALHISKSGLLTMSFREVDTGYFPKMDSKILEGFAEAGTDNLDKYYDDYEE